MAGPSRRYDLKTRAAIPAQWAAWNDDGTRVESPLSEDDFGVCDDFADDGGFA